MSFARLCLLALLLLAAAVASPAAAAVDIDLWEFPRIPDPADPYDRFSWLRGLIVRFEGEHPGVKVHLTELSWQSGADKLKIAVYAGAPPDLTSGALPVKMVEQGVVDPSDPYLRPEDRADYLPGSLEAFQYAGQTWGWPWCSVGDLLYVNLELARARGVKLPADGRWSWEQFLAAVKAMTIPAAEHGGTPVHGFGFVSVLDRSADYGMLCLDGMRPMAGAGQPGLASPEALRSVRRLLDLLGKEGVAPANAGGMEDKDLWQAFSERRNVACGAFGLWALKALERKKPFEFGLMAFPTVDGKGGLSPTATSGYFVFKQSEPEKRRTCHELARFLTNGENQRLLASYGQFPTRHSAGAIYRGQPLMQAAQRIVTGGFPLPTHPRWGTVDSRLKSALQSVFLGSADAAQTLTRLAAETRELATTATATDAVVGGTSAAGGAAALAGLLVVAALGLFWVQRGRLGDGSAYFFLLPSLSVFACFTVWPVLRALLLAFQDYAPGAGMFEGFNGLTNFRQALGAADFVSGIRNTVIYTAVVVPAQIALGLVLASLLYPLSTAARNFFRAAFYLPGVASVVVMAMVWRWLYDDSFGLANRLLSLAPLEPVRQLVANLTPLIARPGWALAALYLTIFLCIVARELLGSARLAGLVAAAAGVGGACWLAFGLEWAWQPAGPVRWLTSTELSLFSIALSTILKGPGGALLIYLAAMEAIPPELFEAARADGAGPLKQWWHVMLPLVRPTTLFLAVTGVIDSFQVFAQVLMLTDGGPAGSSTVIVHQIYTRAFRDLEFGQASAMALMLFAVLVLISFVQYRFLRSDWEF